MKLFMRILWICEAIAMVVLGAGLLVGFLIALNYESNPQSASIYSLSGSDRQALIDAINRRNEEVVNKRGHSMDEVVGSDLLSIKVNNRSVSTLQAMNALKKNELKFLDLTNVSTTLFILTLLGMAYLFLLAKFTYYTLHTIFHLKSLEEHHLIKNK